MTESADDPFFPETGPVKPRGRPPGAKNKEKPPGTPVKPRKKRTPKPPPVFAPEDPREPVDVTDPGTKLPIELETTNPHGPLYPQPPKPPEKLPESPVELKLPESYPTGYMSGSYGWRAVYG